MDVPSILTAPRIVFVAVGNRSEEIVPVKIFAALVVSLVADAASPVILAAAKLAIQSGFV